MGRHCILIVEDEPALARHLQLELEHEGYATIVARTGVEALDRLANETVDLVLLDLMLPQLHGLEVCRRLRSDSDVPVIMVTARDTVGERIAGLDTGADDYLVKPFAIEELLARLRALLRRHHRVKTREPVGNRNLRVGNMELDATSREMRLGGEPISLTKREFDLLHYLMVNRNQVCSRDQILSAVWGYDHDPETNVVDVYVRYLRNKLGKSADVIRTVRGIGYMVKDDHDQP